MVGMMIAITNICAAFHRDAADYQGRIKPEPVTKDLAPRHCIAANMPPTTGPLRWQAVNAVERQHEQRFRVSADRCRAGCPIFERRML